jgi:hypothetical protein
MKTAALLALTLPGRNVAVSYDVADLLATQ